MKRRAIKRLVQWLLLAALAFLLYLLLGATLPNLHHKNVTPEFAERFDASSVYGDAAGTERAAYVGDNVTALEYRLAMIESAQDEVVLAAYEFSADEPGTEVLSALQAAAERGVRVRVLVDGVSARLSLKGDPCFQALAGTENVQIRIYNPVNLLLPWKLQYRMHDKYLIVDDRMYLLGGRNTNRYFLGASEDQKKDSEVFVYESDARADGSLQALRAYFEEVWALDDCRDYRCAKPRAAEEGRAALDAHYAALREKYPDAYRDGMLLENTVETRKVTLLRGSAAAENKRPEVWHALMQVLATGQDVTIHTPYIILSDAMEQDLTALCASAQQVSLITNAVSGGANIFGCADYLNEKDAILATGAIVYEYLGGASLHTKNMLVDDRLCIIGSFNFDMRSAYLDTELMVFVDSPALQTALRADTEQELLCSVRAQAGTEDVPGEHYEPRALTAGKQVLYGILRILIRPFRCLL